MFVEGEWTTELGMTMIIKNGNQVKGIVHLSQIYLITFVTQPCCHVTSATEVQAMTFNIRIQINQVLLHVYETRFMFEKQDFVSFSMQFLVY